MYSVGKGTWVSKKKYAFERFVQSEKSIIRFNMILEESSLEVAGGTSFTVYYTLHFPDVE